MSPQPPVVGSPGPGALSFGPGRVTLDEAPRAVSAGVHSCFVLESGGVQCYGHVRLALAVGASFERRPVDVTLPGPARDVDTAFERSCALLEGGRVACWGAALEREPDRQGASLVTYGGQPLSGVERLAVDAAIDGEGTLLVWGYDDNGELSQRGARPPRSPAEAMQAQRVEADVPVVDVARTPLSLCTLDANGDIECTGGMRLSASRPLDGSAERIPPARELECSYDWCCAVTRDDRLFCWGWEFYLLQGSRPANVDAPYELLRAPIEALAVGHEHLCYETRTGVFCWTDDPLLIGLSGPARTPIEVPLPSR